MCIENNYAAVERWKLNKETLNSFLKRLVLVWIIACIFAHEDFVVKQQNNTSQIPWIVEENNII